MKRIRILEWLKLSLFAAMILVMGAGPAQAAGEIGKTIDKSNCAQYKDVLIPALYRAVEKGDFILPTGNLEVSYKQPDKFLAASKKNEGKFDINADGDLIDKKTGKIPNYNVYGFPFPDIDPKDPKAAAKIMWNFQFQRYRAMGWDKGVKMSWVDRKSGVERDVGGPEFRMFFQGRPPEHKLNNPRNYLTLEMQTIQQPMSARGINTMAWDFFDEREISQYSYISAVRRVRQTSGSSRSDSYMGSDASLDTASLWGGKNRTMTWKIVGEKTILAPFTTTKKLIDEEEPDGTVKRSFPELKWGYNTPGWKGAPWAPTTVTYVPRKVWIIEQMPKDPYYNWGLHILYVDKETCVIFYNEIHTRSGEFRKWGAYLVFYSEAPSGNNTVGREHGLFVIDEQANHATLELNGPERLFLPESKLNANFFTMSNFLELSK